MPHAFRKKPVEIQAMQFEPGTGIAIKEWAKAHGQTILVRNGVLDVPTLEGTMTAEPGDWIIRGVKGEFYPCKPDIFNATYEAVATEA